MQGDLRKYEGKAKAVLTEMTLEEKAGLCSGSDFWMTKGVERMGIDKVMVTDGPHGLRKQAGSSDHLGINKSVPATCFPTAATTACSFDTKLLYEVGEALGEECLQEEVAILLGPGANIKRSPLCGRNFEYFSEDPYQTGKMASAIINGIQSKGIGTSLKHFAANNQETLRMTNNSVVDERALHEIYLPGFEAAVKNAQPWSVMCCYNQVNGVFGSKNNLLLNQILRDEWGFEGLVMTDWGAIVNRVEGLAAGLDLEMPYSGPENDQSIVDAVKSGELKEAIVDRAALRILCMILAATVHKKPGYTYDVNAHHQLARKAAAQSAVLLKNDEGILPIDSGKKLAVVGAFAEEPRYQGAGSSRINPNKLDNLCSVLSERGVDFVYKPGYQMEDDLPDNDLIREAAEAAKEADTVLVCIGLPDAYESEGFDREHMRLPESHVALLAAVAKENPHTVVVLSGGSAMEMDWEPYAKAILMIYLAGEAGALAAADLLFGDVNPSGKLAESFPYKLEDVSSNAYFPGGNRTVEYRESIYVGYRYYDKAGVDVRYPFGYGLSYTSFAYDDFFLEASNDTVLATVRVKNTGAVAGAETVQFYVAPVKPSAFRPIRELKGFDKVFLQPGEEATVSVELDKRAFSYYNAVNHTWKLEQGEYIVSAAASSREIRCEASIYLEGEEPEPIDAPEDYVKPSVPFHASAEAFEKLYGKTLPPMNAKPGEPYTLNSTLGEITQTKVGAEFVQQMMMQMGAGGGSVDTEDPTMQRLIEHMIGELPIRALTLFAAGKISYDLMNQLVAGMNAEIGMTTAD